MEPSDDNLLAQARAGDRDALRALLTRHAPSLRARLAGKIAPAWRSVLDEDDVLQVTYLEAYTRIASFVPSGEGSFLAWLTRIAENNLRDAIKGLKRDKRPQPKRQLTPKDDEASVRGLLDAVGVTTSTPSRHAGRREIVEHVEAAIRKLPADQENVVRRYDLQGLSAKEVAASIGRSEGAMYMLRARAHERLREYLGSESLFISTST